MRFTLLGVCLTYCAYVMALTDNAITIDFGMELTSELQATAEGQYNFANLLRLNASLHISRNLSFDASSISTCMTASESIGGDLQTFSNLDAGNTPFALAVCNIAWQINDRHALYAGIRNMNEDYFTSPVTSFFTNSSCGIYPTISANYPIANYPVASVGMHYCYDGNPIKVKASLYNGTGYNSFTGHENVFRFCPRGDGLFGIAQVEYQHKGSRYFVGNALRYAHESSSPKVNCTPWFYAEQYIGNRTSLLIGYSHAFAEAAECNDFAIMGIRSQLGKYEVGVSTDYAHFADAQEFATEISCKASINPHLYFQPALHLIQTDNAFLAIGMLRLGWTL